MAAALMIAAAGVLVPTVASAADPLPAPSVEMVSYYAEGNGANDAVVVAFFDAPGATHDANKVLKGYQAELKSGVSLAETVQTVTLSNPGATTVLFEDATFGKQYDVAVRAVYEVGGLPEYSVWAYGEGGIFGAGPVTPLKDTPPVAALSASSNASGSILVKWAPPTIPANTLPVQDYTVTASPAYDDDDDFEGYGQADISVTGCMAPCTSAVLKGLRNGVKYDVSVSTVGGPLGGSSGWYGDPYTTATPYGAANKPSSLKATLSGAKAKLKWKASKVTAGAPLTGYKIYVNGTLKKTVSKATTSWSATKIKKGKSYTFTVKAYNAHGASAPLTLKKKWKKS